MRHYIKRVGLFEFYPDIGRKRAENPFWGIDLDRRSERSDQERLYLYRGQLLTDEEIRRVMAEEWQEDALARTKDVEEEVPPEKPRREIQIITVDDGSERPGRARQRAAQRQKMKRRKARRRIALLLLGTVAIVSLVLWFALPGTMVNNWIGELAGRIQGVSPFALLGQAVSSGDTVDGPDITALSAAPLPETEPTAQGVSYSHFLNGAGVDKVSRAANIALGGAGSYTQLPGVLTFRGDNLRQGNAYGTAKLGEKKLETIWAFPIDAIDSWTGIGWSGQPALVQWPEALRAQMNLLPDKLAKEGLVEGIYAALDGNIYFFDIDDGVRTREPIEIGYPIRGSVSVDPRGIPILYSGQGLSRNKDTRGLIGYHAYNLLDSEKLFFIDGRDDNSYRASGAFDASGLVDANSDTLIVQGENGLLYTAELGTQYDAGDGTLSVNPTVYSYRYKSEAGSVVGTQNSIAMYGQYGYFADNSGLLTCMDMNTLTPVWARDVGDDTDATIALDPEGEGGVALYTACKVDRQQAGSSYIRRIDALSGKIEWEYAQPCEYIRDSNAGAIASPLVGKEGLAELVFFAVSQIEEGGSKLFAFNKKSGEIVWTRDFGGSVYSSPVGVYDEAGNGYILQGDSRGMLHLLDGLTGDLLDSAQLDGSIEGTPAVYDDIAVIGTRGQKIYGIRIS